MRLRRTLPADEGGAEISTLPFRSSRNYRLTPMTPRVTGVRA